MRSLAGTADRSAWHACCKGWLQQAGRHGRAAAASGLLSGLSFWPPAAPIVTRQQPTRHAARRQHIARRPSWGVRSAIADSFHRASLLAPYGRVLLCRSRNEPVALPVISSTSGRASNGHRAAEQGGAGAGRRSEAPNVGVCPAGSLVTRSWSAAAGCSGAGLMAKCLHNFSRRRASGELPSAFET